MKRLGHVYGYDIKLSCGNCWQLIAIKEVRPWVDKFAHIMELERSSLNNYPKIFFTNHDKDINTIIPEGSSAIQWFPFYEGDNYTIYNNKITVDLLCNIGEIKQDKSDYFKMLYSLSPIYLNAVNNGGCPLHSALVERNGYGILLSAPGGTGKTTCCKRIPPPWRALCDDEALISRCEKGHYEVHPFPTWSDYFNKREKKTWNVQEHVEVKAIFFLIQSQQDHIKPVAPGKAALLIYSAAIASCNRLFLNLKKECQLEIFKKVFNNACEMSAHIPAYELYVSRNGKFWELINVPPIE